MTAARLRAVLLGAALCTAGAITILLTSDREDATIAWAVLAPIVNSPYPASTIVRSVPRGRRPVGKLTRRCRNTAAHTPATTSPTEKANAEFTSEIAATHQAKPRATMSRPTRLPGRRCVA